MLKVAESLKKSKMMLVVDRDGERIDAALVMPGEGISEATLNKAVTFGRGPLHLVVSQERAEAFGLQLMSSSRLFALNQEGDADSQCISIEAREGVSTGISISDRVCTIGILSEKNPDRRKIVSPGHIVPFMARDGGVLVRHSLKEAALDLVRSAGFTDAAIILECLNGAGSHLSSDDLRALESALQITSVSIDEIIRERLASEPLVTREAETNIPTDFGGVFRGIIYKTPLQGREPLVLIKGDISSVEPVLTRVHVENTFEDIFGGGLSNRRSLLHASMHRIAAEGTGIVLYLRRGSSYQRQSKVNTPQKSDRIKEYGLGAQVLLDLGIKRIKLLTNSKQNLIGLNSFGIDIVDTEPLLTTDPNQGAFV
jgi:3,4-dihydroxy 2-butanone 4-phosphate synthase/GTP cyclohydrolase II